MNNKGFAITSVIYGLAILGMMIVLILMGTVSASRRNVVEQAEKVEEFLINLNKTTGVYTSNGIFVVPSGESGWYRIEIFGPNAVSLDGLSTEKYHGTYTTGIIFLRENEQYNIRMDNLSGNPSISFETETHVTLMKAGGATGFYPAGGLKCYYKPATGAKIIEHQELDPSDPTLTGIQNVSFGDGFCNPSIIVGNPNSGNVSATPTTHFFVNSLILPGASGDDDGKLIITHLANKSDFNDIPVKNEFFENVTQINVDNGSGIPGLSVYYSYHVEDGDGFKSYVVNCGTNCSFASRTIDDINIYSSDLKAQSKGLIVRLRNASGNHEVYNGKANYGQTFGDTGIHLSAYQPKTSGNFATHGNYYLIPVSDERKVITASNNVADPIKKVFIKGETNQKWAIDKIDGNFPNITSGSEEFRIMELSKYKAMGISLDENYEYNTISAKETFNSLSRNDPQIWKIEPNGDGTIAIKTVVAPLYEDSGYLYANSTDENICIGTGGTPKTVQRFYAYSLDFGEEYYG